jgi:xanthine dehydrogenase accessory factor
LDSLDNQVLEQLQNWLLEGGVHWLCTIVETFGSAPRPVGSLLAVSAAGQTVGSLSGGCVEEDLVDKIIAGKHAANLPEFVDYGASAEHNERMGLPCGGRLKVMIEPFGAEQIANLGVILARLEQRACLRRVLDLTTGIFELQPCQHFSPLHVDADSLHQTYGPRFQLLLIGAGQLSLSLAALAQSLDYRVVVCDPRPELIKQWSLSGVELLQQMPDDAVRERASDPYSIVITLTHDPRIDDMALMEALTTEAFYVGALGSKKTTEQRLLRLAALGLTQQQLARLHAPVGLAIGSKTPPEIAISILAQLTQLRSVHKRQAALSVA